MKAVVRFLLSLKTVFGFFLIFIVLTFIGSIMLPNNLAYFSGIDDTPLFRWLSESDDYMLTWWIYAIILMLALLALSTIFCTVDGLLKKVSGRNLILKLSPQIMHIGVLFIMLGHLLTASIGFKTDVLVKKGEGKTVAENIGVYFEDIKVETDRWGYDTMWEAKLWWLEDRKKVREVLLRPVHPLYFKGLGFYFRSVNMGEELSVLIRVCRDPGTQWALLGGVLLSVGGIGFMYGRFRA